MSGEPIVFRPMLESLEPRCLLSAAMAEPIISIAEFSFGVFGGSPATMAMPMHVDYQQFSSPPLGGDASSNPSNRPSAIANSR